MPRQRKMSLVMARVTLVSLAILLCAIPALAQSSSGYILLIASGFLCDPGDTSTCPAVAKSANGDSFEMSGAGTFDLQNKSVKAAGTYSHKSPNGNVLQTGVWIASELVSFDSYGAAPGALSRQRVGLGPAPFGSKPTPPMMLGGVPTGGLAVFRIRLLPVKGSPTTAVLQVNCALADVPRERAVEGIRLTIEKNNSEYSEESGGRVMFLFDKALNEQAREGAPQEEKAPETSEQPFN
ncbi:MAG TPA: hypothetical protein VEI52_15555 [Terriglobales bacterium]|nr:hypothetical protein [Terriglobales bacterium]